MYEIFGFSWPDMLQFFYYPVPDPVGMLNGSGYRNRIFYYQYNSITS